MTADKIALKYASVEDLTAVLLLVEEETDRLEERLATEHRSVFDVIYGLLSRIEALEKGLQMNGERFDRLDQLEENMLKALGGGGT